MTNIKKASLILEQLADWGVDTLCLCPGARNAPFVSLLSKSRGFEVLSFFDERSAGFFALGRSRRDQKPSAVLVTSGTGVSELLSSVIEAYYSETCLVVVSSDRPKRLRKTGAPQTIDQSVIFKNYIEKSLDLENFENFHIQSELKKPIHINICFEEPLVDEKICQKKFFPRQVSIDGEKNQSCFKSHTSSEEKSLKNTEKSLLKNCLVVVGALKESQRPAVTGSLLNLKVPIFIESLSGLRVQKKLKEKCLFSGDKILSKMIQSGEVQSILRIGDVPLGRYWRDLDQKNLPIMSLSDKNFPGTDKSEIQIHSLLEDPLNSFYLPPWNWSHWKKRDRQIYGKVQEKARNLPFSEAGLVFELTKQIPTDHSVYLGNSLPVRLWDLVSQKHSFLFANRGANGIDGQLSTALGLHDLKSPLWIILGDLTTLYDFSGFWLTNYLVEKKVCVNLIVINNCGGRIFSRLFDESLFCNRHQLNFQKMAEFWNWSYKKPETKGFLNLSEGKSKGLNFYELCVDENDNKNFWKLYDQL